MASTYTINTGIELITNGEQSGTGGDTTNTNLEIVDRLTSGVGAITLSGTTHTLSTADGALSEGQYKVLVLGGSPSGTNTVTVSPNDQSKQYFIVNNSGESVIISQGSGATVTIADGATDIIYCDGGGAGAAVTSFGTDLSGVLTTGAIGTTVLAYDANLQSFVTALTLPTSDGTSGQALVTDGSGNISFGTDLSGVLTSANNLSDVANAGTSRTNLGLGTAAVGDIGTDVLAYDANLQSFVTALTLPTSDGTSGQALVTDGSGTISFGSAGISTGKAIAMAIVFG